MPGYTTGTRKETRVEGKHSEDFIAENPCRDLHKAIRLQLNVSEEVRECQIILEYSTAHNTRYSATQDISNNSACMHSSELYTPPVKVRRRSSLYTSGCHNSLRVTIVHYMSLDYVGTIESIHLYEYTYDGVHCTSLYSSGAWDFSISF